MKGMVFRSFQGFVEREFSELLVDEMLSLENLESQGAYTSVGYYPHSEFLTLAVHVSEATETPISELVQSFGEALFKDLAQAHADMIADYDTAIQLLADIETVIHVDVRKLYSNSELPRFDVKEREGDRHIVLEYSSSRPFADLAEGLIYGCLDHYGLKETSSIMRQDVKSDGTHSVFDVQAHNGRST
ncbi:MAG: heme NO-binding domain-containing protein [Pseudomonadota bacterium]